MGAAPPEEQGVASGTLATFRVIGQSLSVAVAGAVFAGFGAAAAGSALAAGRGTLSIEQVRDVAANVRNRPARRLRGVRRVCGRGSGDRVGPGEGNRCTLPPAERA